ncbi:MAG: hypothetical protein IT364_14115 [Candidatus Hydrogenedentes bacterium]|nr:hypothetical protein [Candidatus Hydrogenedentota bacterium]
MKCVKSRPGNASAVRVLLDGTPAPTCGFCCEAWNGLRRPSCWAAFLLFSACTLHTGAASPFYSVAELDGTWWLVTPSGGEFFSLGVNCVGAGQTLPPEPDKPQYAYARFYDSLDAWADDATRRLRVWNFNTIGGWSDPHATRRGLPDTPVLHLGVSSGVHWGDLFSEDVEREVDRLAREMVLPRASDPDVLGWFSDNELGWYPETMFLSYLSAPPANQTRQRLVALLKERYGNTWEALAQGFAATGADSFATLEKGGVLHLRTGGSGRETVHAFAEVVASRYYQLMHDAIRRYDPNHLILGDRYNGHYPLAVARAAGPFVDVVSTNASFADTKDGAMFPFFLKTLNHLTGKPVLMSEYYAAAMENQSGNRNSSTDMFAALQTQTERIALTERTLRDLASLPFVVGAHWFQYFDEPPGGRSDGEDFNFGLVDIENRPYEGLVRVMAELQGRLPDIHRASPAGYAHAQSAEVHVPGSPANPFLGLHTWNKTDGYIAYTSETAFGDLYVCRDDSYLYLGLRADDYMDASIYADKTIPAEDFMTLRFGLGETLKPVTLRFAMGNAATCDNPAVRFRHEDRGLRQIVIAGIPIALIPEARDAADASLRLRAEAIGYARYMRTAWDSLLTLARP